MGYWQTKSGNKYKVNIAHDHIIAMKNMGACFCWAKDTPGINDENNETFYAEDNDNGEEKSKVFRQGITVTAENGEQVTGYVSHWVENKHGQTFGTDIRGWFIFQPGTYPTEYIKRNTEEDVVVTDL